MAHYRLTVIALLALTLLATACSQDEELPADDYPSVRAPDAAEDLDPTLAVAEYELVVDEAEVALFEDTAPVAMYAYNGQVPGPVLHARVGETVRVHVTNNLSMPTSVHWYGMRVPFEMDGVNINGVYAIGPGQTFTYEFVARDAGTFWYRPHVQANVQVEAGLYGGFIVHEADEIRPDVDADRLVILDDLLLDSDESLAAHDMEHHTRMHGRTGNALIANGAERAPRVHMAPGEVQRWRLVNAANARPFDLVFPGLEVRQIGRDGCLWKQDWTRDIETLFLPMGARADLEVRLAEDTTDGELAAIVLTQGSFGPVETEIELVPVRLDEDAEPSSAAGHTSDPTYELPSADATSDIDHTAHFGVGFNDADQAQWMIDQKTWPEYTEWEVAVGDEQVIELVNDVGFEYPLHFHGTRFKVLSRNNQAVDEPGLRDTVWLEGDSSVVIAATYDAPGSWVYQSSLLEYSILGMMGVVEVR
ncbi:MAG TPA: hypothetical protein DIU15_02080 [Deltaproteobacteria bacterium]|nr:hypothetical protein [Deltaproteobacteria bacterium]